MTKKKVTKKVVVQPDKAEVLWNELRNLPIEVFALPNQRVEDHLNRVAGIPNKLYLRTKSAAALPAFETLLNGLSIIRVERTAEGDPVNVSYPKYIMEENDMYIVVEHFIPPTERPELQPVKTMTTKDHMVVVDGEVDTPVTHAPLAKAAKPE